MDRETMQALVLSYQENGEGLELIFDAMARLLLLEPKRFGFEGEDDAAEALFRYRRRLRSLPARYVDHGSSFEAYVVTSLRYLARTMRREGRRHREREIVCERSEGWELEVRSLSSGIPRLQDAEWTMPRTRHPSASQRAAFKARLVYLYLKCAWEADDEKTARVASAAEVDSGWLCAAMAQALRSLEPERQRHERLVVRRDRSWGRIRLLEARLRDECDGEAKKRIEGSLERERRCLSRAREELRHFRPIVPNSVVARIIGVPKGTVDSGLYYLKRCEGRNPAD